MENIEIQFVDRYSASGIPRPDENSCMECEAMGIYPIEKGNLNAEAVKAPEGKLLIIGQKEEDGSPTEEDNWLFVQCPHCKGTKKKQ